MPQLLPLSLLNRRPARIRPRLSILRHVLEKLGNPESHAPSILIVGTNGKGSTAALLESLLAAHGLVTGLYTSPHLIRVEERIRIGGVPITNTELESHLTLLDEFPELTFFETLTAAAFCAFRNHDVDVIVLEAGMGGRWDATRVANSSIAGLTNVGTDHQAWLGGTRQRIAQDKATALQAAPHAVLGPGVDADILATLEVAHAISSDELVSLSEVDTKRVAVQHEQFEFQFESPFTGRHQLQNLHLALALAVAAQDAGLVQLDDSAILRGLEATKWPGRLTFHNVLGRQVLLDAGHNLEAAACLASHLAEAERRPNLLFSCLDDKPVEAMAELLCPVVSQIAICPLSDERTMSMDRLESAFPCAEVAHDPLTALELLPDPVVATGSLRLVGALLRHADREIESK
ncbi:MAG: hypothetical protein GY906_20860 [bacterium]|nr:hypothetical protein [bacterium]